MKRVVSKAGDVTRYFGSEDGKHYRGFRQDHAGIKQHVRFLNHKVNEAPARGNRSGWQYAGSVPMAVLIDWMTKTGTPMDVWARNEGGAKDKFMAWLKSEHPALFPKPGVAARPKIVVPTTYKVREKVHG